MYNKNIPAQNELPSTKQLITSTCIAAAFASIILITAILPAEYEIDPTGIGRAVGFVEMAEIKSLLIKEQKESEAQAVARASSALQDVTPDIASPVVKEVVALQSDSKVFVLTPGQSAEIKLSMQKGEKADYKWVTQGGELNFDTHGDAQDISYHGYGKGRGVTSDKGVLKAAFDGSHGWFWRNRSKQNVEVTLTTQGQYGSIKRVQ